MKKMDYFYNLFLSASLAEQQEPTQKPDWVESSFDYQESKMGSAFLRPHLRYRHLKRVFLFFVVLLGILIIRLAYLQIWEGDRFEGLAQQNRTKTTYLFPLRGMIYDHRGTVLVQNLPDFYLELIPAYIPKDPEGLQIFLKTLGEIVQKDPDVLRKELKLDVYQTFLSYQPRILREHVEYDQALLLKIKSANVPGVELRTSFKRQYLLNRGNKTALSLSHLLGYTGKMTIEGLEELQDQGYVVGDVLGKQGIEASYEKDLRGVHGVRKAEVNALGREMKVLSSQESVRGTDIYLTLDASLQADVEYILRTYLQKNGYQKGVVIVMDPNNFGIKTMVSWPAFDSNEFSFGLSTRRYQELSSDPTAPLFNRAIFGEYPSGSIFKLVMSAAALQEGVITQNTTITSTGGLQVGQWFFPDWKAGGHGPVNVVEALSQSVNTFFYYISGGYQGFQGLGVTRMLAYASQFGLGKKTGIDLLGEHTGFLPSPEWKKNTLDENWYVGDTYNLGIGQGYLLVTPLQLAQLTGFFANGGTIYQPHVLESKIYPDGREEEYIPKVVNQSFIEKSYVNVVRAGMRRAVLTGSARKLSDLPFTSGGKTGTAQFSSVKDPHAWFTAFAPYEHPEVVVTVLIEEGKEGSDSAIDVAKQVLSVYFAKYSEL